MYCAELRFPNIAHLDDDQLSEAIMNLLSALRMNGQVCGREWPIHRLDQTCTAVVFIPEPTALDPAHANNHVTHALERLRSAGIGPFELRIRGAEIASAHGCQCRQRSHYLLYTTYVSLESPLRCGTCFQPIPLYTIPPTYDDEYADMIAWASDYQACDQLYMNSSTLERAALQELSRIDRNLARRGMAITATITQATAIPTYYYLYRATGRSRTSELRRRCPSCNEAWRLDAPWHHFDFRCDRCHLVSNIAWNVQ